MYGQGILAPLGKASRSPGARRPLRSRHLQIPRGRDGGAAHLGAGARPSPHRRGWAFFAMRRRAHRTHLAGLLLFAVAACGREGRPVPPPASPGRISVVDDAGRSVALAQPPARIVSLSPAVTELLFALGAGDRLVGRTTWCDYPPAARQVPSVGDGLNPNIEAVAARHPDLVVLYRSALNETAAAQFARLGIPAVVVQQDRLEDIARAARLLGHLTGTDRAGDSLAGALEQPVAGSGVPRRPRPR